MSLDYVIASDGVQVPIGSLAQTFTYDAFGNLETITVEYAEKTYVQTFVFSAEVNGKMQSVSQWELQP
jgi:hypothetical protein